MENRALFILLFWHSVSSCRRVQMDRDACWDSDAL